MLAEELLANPMRGFWFGFLLAHRRTGSTQRRRRSSGRNQNWRRLQPSEHEQSLELALGLGREQERALGREQACQLMHWQPWRWLGGEECTLQLPIRHHALG